MAESIEDRLNNVPHECLRRSFVIEYCQNMGLPHVVKEQPDSSYYLSQKIIYTLGIADISYQNPKLYAYLYEEGSDKKGGNNVASIITKYLFKNGVLQDTEKGAQLTLFFDN